MRASLYLNERSFETQATCDRVAENWISDLVFVTIKLVHGGANRSLCHPAGICCEKIGPNYDIQRWLSDNRINREKRSFFRSLLTKVPYFEDIDITEECKGFESRYNGVTNVGLGLAYLRNGVSVGLLSERHWDSPYLEIEFSYLGDNQEIVTQKKGVRHATSMNHVGTHRDWLRQKCLELAITGEHLIEYLPNLFPSIILCNNACKQVRELNKGDVHLKQLLNIFGKFQEYAGSWCSGPFEPSVVGCDISTESQATLQKYEIERTFTCPDGSNITFSWHVKFNPGAWRMFFYPDASKRKFVVGYIGKHLPIASEN